MNNDTALWDIQDCYVDGVADFDSLMLSISTGHHDIDASDFSARLHEKGLIEEDADWDWGTVRIAIQDGKIDADTVDWYIHQGLS